ncbi:MAG: hypothetical protein KG075_13165 [Alphaproteobacteria bacterium]|nr:hypothetical protein [Alphaproteobacteria bacterium]
MQQRHINEIMLRLEQLSDTGAATIRTTELMNWYGQVRITVGIWRDLLAKWEELLERWGEDKDMPLLVSATYHGDTYIFIWGEGLTLTKDAWLEDIRDLAKNGKTRPRRTVKRQAS